MTTTTQAPGAHPYRLTPEELDALDPDPITTGPSPFAIVCFAVIVGAVVVAKLMDERADKEAATAKAAATATKRHACPPMLYPLAHQ